MGGKVLTLWSEELRNEGRTAERHALCCKLHQRGMDISDIADLIQESPTVVADWIASSNILA